jgi:hypothetical protein
MKSIVATDSSNKFFVGWTLAGSTWLLTHTDSLKLLFSFKIKWPEKPEYKCLSQTQNKFKAASCNVCIKDINISNIGGRVDVSHI